MDNTELGKQIGLTFAMLVIFALLFGAFLFFIDKGFGHLREVEKARVQEVYDARSTKVAQMYQEPPDFVCYQGAVGATEAEREAENSIISALFDQTLYPDASWEVPQYLGRTEKAQCVLVKVDATEVRITTEISRGNRRVVIVEDEFVRIADKKEYVHYVNQTLPQLVNQAVEAMWNDNISSIASCSSIYNRECEVAKH